MSDKTIVIFGFGPGVSKAVAEKFGAEGFSVALVGRDKGRVGRGAEQLKMAGIKAMAVPADASDPDAVKAALEAVRAELGPITVIHWNAYSGTEAGDILTADPDAVHAIFEVAISGLLAAVQAALPDLRGTGEGAILVTNGAFGDLTPTMDLYAVGTEQMGVALANSAKAKLVGLLAQRLKEDKVYVGEVTIAGTVAGTKYDVNGHGFEGPVIADAFWKLYQDRGEVRRRLV